MAKLIESVIVVKLSRLVRDSEEDVAPIITDEQLTDLGDVVGSLLDNSVLVEIERV